MKIPFLFLLSISCLSFGYLSATVEEDKFVKLDIVSNKLSIKKESDRWLRISVPFKFINHPKIEALNGRRPSTVSQAFNPKYINDVKVKLWLCFTNKFKQNLLSSNNNLKDSDFYQYYSAEVEYLTLEFDRSTKNATFLFPASIAERDGFLETYVKPVGYIVEISHAGKAFQISNSIYFNYRGVTDQILDTFKAQAISKSSENEGILLPAHKVNESYLSGMGTVKFEN